MDVKDLDTAESVGISVQGLEAQLSNVMTAFAETVSRRKFALTAGDLAELKKIADLSGIIKRHAANIVETVEVRRLNLVQSSDIDFISLGADCFPRTLATRWGFKKTAKLGERTHPFDLAIHPSGSVRDLLLDNFTGYFDGGLQFDRKRNYCVHPQKGIELNHEIGEEFADNDFEKLREKYSARAENFERALGASNQAVFVHHTADLINSETIATVKEIFEIVSKKRDGRDTAFVWLYTPPHEAGENFKSQVGNNIAFIQAPYPFRNYVWYNPKHTFSLRGVRFEKHIISQITDFLQQLNWSSSRSA